MLGSDWRWFQLQQKEQDLEDLLEMREWKTKEDEESFMVRSWFKSRFSGVETRIVQMRLEDAGFDKEKDLHDMIKKLEADLKKAKKKDLGEEDLPVCKKVKTPHFHF